MSDTVKCDVCEGGLDADGRCSFCGFLIITSAGYTARPDGAGGFVPGPPIEDEDEEAADEE